MIDVIDPRFQQSIPPRPTMTMPPPQTKISPSVPSGASQNAPPPTAQVSPGLTSQQPSPGSSAAAAGASITSVDQEKVKLII